MTSGHRSAAMLAALVLTVIGASTFNVLPLITSGATDTMGLSDAQVGLLSLTICIGSAGSALLAGMWVRVVHWRRAARLALAGMLVTNTLAMLVHQFITLVLLQGAAGMFAAAGLCLGLTILSDNPESARSFGLCNAVQVAYQVLAILAGPTLLKLGSFNGILTMLAAPCCVAIPLMSLLPMGGRVVMPELSQKALFKPATLIALISFGIFFINAGAYWTYIELIGEARGMTSRVVANCVAIGVSAGILGGIAAWALGDRFGRLWPLCVSSLLIVIAALLLIGPFGVIAFVLSVLLYFLAWNCAVAYQLAVVNAVDTTGRGVAITQALAFLGSAAGAGVAALVISPGDYRAVIWLVVFAACFSTGLFALVTQRAKVTTVSAT